MARLFPTDKEGNLVAYGQRQAKRLLLFDRNGGSDLTLASFRHSSTRSSKYTRTLRALDKGNRIIYRAWRLKDEFERF